MLSDTIRTCALTRFVVRVRVDWCLLLLHGSLRISANSLVPRRRRSGAQSGGGALARAAPPLGRGKHGFNTQSHAAVELAFSSHAFTFV
eukprot:5384969-Pleurochrysis_carterae.AAC.1